jgi:hypothetical protein
VLASAACQAHPEAVRRFLAPVAPYTGGQGKLWDYKYHDTKEAR